jgi:hypothetical protein
VTGFSTTRAQLPRGVAALAVTVLACAIVISRRVDAFTNPQFFAEDGSKWFVDAYNHGPLGALDLSFMGYFQVVSRLAPVVAAPFGVANTPLVFNTFGLLIQVAPVALFLSSRFDPVVPSFPARVAVSAVYILMPSTELNVDVTTAQFHLFMLAFLVIVAESPKHWYSTAFDVSIVAVCGLSGPFAYILAPVAMLWFVIRRRRFTLVLCGVLAADIPIQLLAAFTSPRLHEALGASLHNLVLIVADRVVLAGMFAEEGGMHIVLAGTAHGTLLSGVLCLLAVPVVAFAAMRAPYQLRLFDLAAAAIVVSGMTSPLVSNTGNAWAIMSVTAAGERYFYFAQIAWVVTLLWAASRLPSALLRRPAWCLIAAAFASGLIMAWRYPPFTDFHWAQEARAITTGTPGTNVVLPIPPGDGWSVALTVK